MAEYTPQTVKELIEDIEKGRVILPAMQRNFVWSEEKMCHLFDSLMRDYPIGTFLFWNVDKDTFSKYMFNTFIKDYDEYNGKMQRGAKATAEFSDYKAVLDGQQRITSLYIGVKGKYRTHIKGKKWDDPTAYYDRFLCLNIMNVPSNEEHYQFSFKQVGDIENFILNDKGIYEFWIKVSTVYDFDDTSGINYIHNLTMNNPDKVQAADFANAIQMITFLRNAFHQKQNVNYHLSKNKSLSEVVDMFVRVNSGGEKLNASDLMLSVATGEQGDNDIHVEIQNALESINMAPSNPEEGFKVDKDLLLTGGLLLTGATSLSLKNNDNYSSSRMNEIFKDHWDAIIDAFKATVIYIEYLGFNGRKLPSKNLVLPIAYYFYKHGYGGNYINSASNSAACDRIFIRQWLLRAMFNNIFRDGTGSTLLQIRNIMDHPTQTKHFPLKDLMIKESKRTLHIGEEQIEEILNMRYGDSKIMPLFYELSKTAYNYNDQVDHIWPKSIITSKREVKKLYPTATDHDVQSFKERCHYICNLQILDRVVNNEKSDNVFEDWLLSHYPDDTLKRLYLKSHFIPEDISYKFIDFIEFCRQREALLKNEITKAFPSDFDKIVERHNLQNKLN